MKRILPVGMPLFKAYPSLSDLTAILGNDERFPIWITNNFNQLTTYKAAANKNQFYTFLDDIPAEWNTIFSDIPILKYNVILDDLLIAGYDKVTAFIVNTINAGYYIRIFMDNYYIPYHKYTYQKRHFIHQKLIFGYDEEAKLIYMTDFANGLKYNSYTATFDEVDDAYHNSVNMRVEQNNYIVCVKPKDSSLKLEFDFNKIRNSLTDYLNSCDSTRKLLNSIRWKGYSFTYGVECYDKIISDIKSGNTSKQALCVIEDHAASMEYKLNVIHSENGFDSESTYEKLHDAIMKIKAQSLTNRNLYLKYTMLSSRLNDDNISNLTGRYEKLKKMSMEFTRSFIDALRYPILMQKLKSSAVIQNGTIPKNMIVPEATWDKCVLKLPHRYYGKVQINFDITPIKMSHIFLIGFSQLGNGINYFNDLPISFRLWKKIGCFEAYNKIIDMQDNAVYPEMLKIYHVEMDIDLQEQLYNVFVTDDNKVIKIATDYKYRETAKVPEYIDAAAFVCMSNSDGFVENLTVNGDMVSASERGVDYCLPKLEFAVNSTEYAFEAIFKFVDESSKLMLNMESESEAFIVEVEKELLYIGSNATLITSICCNAWNRLTVSVYCDMVNVFINGRFFVRRRLEIGRQINCLNLISENSHIYGSKLVELENYAR